MTVAELITALQQMPPDADVIHTGELVAQPEYEDEQYEQSVDVVQLVTRDRLVHVPGRRRRQRQPVQEVLLW